MKEYTAPQAYVVNFDNDYVAASNDFKPPKPSQSHGSNQNGYGCGDSNSQMGCGEYFG